MVADPLVGSQLMICAVCLQEIIPFIDKQWENLTTQTRRTKQTWHATVAKTLVYTQFYSDTQQETSKSKMLFGKFIQQRCTNICFFSLHAYFLDYLCVIIW